MHHEDTTQTSSVDNSEQLDVENTFETKESPMAIELRTSKSTRPPGNCTAIRIEKRNNSDSPLYEKRRKKIKNDIASQALGVMKNFVQKDAPLSIGDALECFGNFVTATLRELPPEQVKCKQKKIMEILLQD